MRAGVLLVVIIFALIVPAGTAMADSCFVELDVDGIIGNGPDILEGLAADTLKVDVWFLGQLAYELQGADVVLCDNEAGPGPVTYRYAWCRLGWPFLGYGYELPDGCAELQFDNHGHPSEGTDLPALVGSFVFDVSEVTSDTRISVDESRSTYDGYFGTESFDGSSGIVIRFPSTSADLSTWGTVKALFR